LEHAGLDPYTSLTEANDMVFEHLKGDPSWLTRDYRKPWTL